MVFFHLIDKVKKCSDSLQRSPVAYNQGSLLTPFPAVVRIKPKVKKSRKAIVGYVEGKDKELQEEEFVEDVKKLVQSLSHNKSRGSKR